MVQNKLNYRYLNRLWHILSLITGEILKMRQKFLHANYPIWFVNSVIKQFNEKSTEEEDDILPINFFEFEKEVIYGSPKR